MPNITLVRSHLFEAIGREYSDHEFDELCFEFGVEVDDVCTEVELPSSHRCILRLRLGGRVHCGWHL